MPARNARQIREDPFPLPKPVIERVLNQGELALLSGSFDSFKSTFAIELAYAIVTGELFLGRFKVVNPGATYLYQQEIHPGEFDDRINKLNVNSTHQDNFWVDYDSFSFKGHGFELPLVKMISDLHPRLVTFDPLSNFWPPGMEENSNAWVTSILKPLLGIRQTGTSMLLVHGDAKERGDGQAPVRARGASDLLYKPDVRIFLDRLTDDDGILLDRVRITMRTRNRERVSPFYADYNKRTGRLIADEELEL